MKSKPYTYISCNSTTFSVCCFRSISSTIVSESSLRTPIKKVSVSSPDLLANTLSLVVSNIVQYHVCVVGPLKLVENVILNLPLVLICSNISPPYLADITL